MRIADRELVRAIRENPFRWIAGCSDCHLSSGYLVSEELADELLIGHEGHDTWKSRTK